VHCPQSTVHSPQSTVHSPQSTVTCPQLTVHSSLSTVHCPQFTEQSIVHSPQFTLDPLCVRVIYNEFANISEEQKAIMTHNYTTLLFTPDMYVFNT
jgi:hypothetical protein